MFALKRFISNSAGGPSYEPVNDDPDAELALGGSRQQRKPLWRRILIPVLFIIALFAVLASIASYMGGPSPTRRPSSGADNSSPPPAEPWDDIDYETDLPTTDPVALARASLRALRSRQSKTLAQATSRYTLKTGRSPPQNYDKWFKMAQDKKCLIDEYDLIHRDFEPWYQIARIDPKHFNGMIDRGRTLMTINSMGMDTIKIKNGEVHMPRYQGTSFDNDWPRTLGRFVSVLPDMDFMLNGRDEPRVVFDVRAPGAIENARNLTNGNDAFHIEPHPTADWFAQRTGCDPLSAPKGFGMDGSADIAFLRSSSSSDFTTDFWPLLSMTKISPCFSDILYPGQYFYDESWWSGSFEYADNVKWEDKKPQIYWRGMSNGGHIIGENYHRFPRFRLIDIARNHSDLVDAKMTRFAESHCTNECDRERVINEYDINGPQSPKEEVYQFKYLLDVDGNTFSGRFLGLLRSGSLVFKSTAFDEYFNDWLKPYEHYVPVLPDLSDMVEKVQWAIENEAEARRIQQTGKLFAEKLMTDDQNDCYFSLVLLEWARLQSGARIADL